MVLQMVPSVDKGLRRNFKNIFVAVGGGGGDVRSMIKKKQILNK